MMPSHPPRDNKACHLYLWSPTPEETPCPNCPESSAGASQQNFFARNQQDTPPPPRRQNTEENAPRFKPMSLPNFDPKGNIHTFIRLFEISMYGANNQDKAITLLNQLDAASTNLIIPHMPQNDWSYAAAKQALLYKFGSIARVMEQKNKFLMIQFQKDKSIAKFADQFYLEEQVLTGSGSLTVHDAHIALRSAIKPYRALYHTLMPAFQDNCSINGMVQYLCQCGDTFGPPKALVKPIPLPTPPARTEGSRRFAPKADMSKVTCHCCNCKGHYTNSCTSKTGVHVLPPQDITTQGKDQVE
ncbi:hypothetical protein DSO57_1010145 [Entomophthora muscae]|uniref:Uncharacterized protein n=1 Tax=Entomophthora muscae TaxID=34485 RepID=A0ACC2TII5_9FUNG|nr:hypothetical protein DSO57_1010145 [Entomophthora muscae]